MKNMKITQSAVISIATLLFALGILILSSNNAQAAPLKSDVPFQEKFQCLMFEGESYCQSDEYTVPAGYRLRIEHITGATASSQNSSAFLAISNPDTTITYTLALGNPQSWYQWTNFRRVGQAILGFANAGDYVKVGLNLDNKVSSDEGSSSVTVIISGYLQPLQ